MSEINEKKLETIRALLVKADATDFPEEADAFRKKADALMTQFAIEAWMVEQAQGQVNARPEPISRNLNYNWFYKSPVGEALWSMFWDVASHCRVQIVTYKFGIGGPRTVPVVGLPADIDYFGMLFTSLMLQLGKQVEPKPLDTLTYIENVVAMREASQGWPRIAQLLFENGQLDTSRWDDLPEQWRSMSDAQQQSLRSKCARDYANYCKENNHPKTYTNPKTWVRNFAGGFVSGVHDQLRGQRDEQGQFTGSMALALRDVRKVVDDARVEMFGERPKSKGVARYARDTRKEDWAARNAGHKAGVKADIAGHTSHRVNGQKQLDR